MTRPAIHPGEILADELEELGVSPTELARQINVPANRISQIINGKRAITGDTALRFGHWFRTSAEFWLNLQAAYDLRMAEQAAGAEIEALPVRPEGKPSRSSPALCDHRIQELERQTRGAEEAMSADDYLYRILMRERASRSAARRVGAR